jgi:transcription elongation factor Elf1
MEPLFHRRVGATAMDRTTRCLKCGKRTISVVTAIGRTDLQCIRCDQVTPLKTELAKWVENPLIRPE